MCKFAFFKVVLFSEMNLQNISNLKTFDSYSIIKRLQKSIQVIIGRLKYYVCCFRCDCATSDKAETHYLWQIAQIGIPLPSER